MSVTKFVCRNFSTFASLGALNMSRRREHFISNQCISEKKTSSHNVAVTLWARTGESKCSEPSSGRVFFHQNRIRWAIDDRIKLSLLVGSL